MEKMKFKAWDKQENKMITNGCLGAGSSSQLIVIEWDGRLSLCNAFGLQDGSNPTFDTPVTERFEMLKYIGLKDKNNKEIYVGDIISHNNNHYVMVESENFGIVALATNKEYKTFTGILMTNHSHREFNWIYRIKKYVEVVGDIYQNPELIK